MKTVIVTAGSGGYRAWAARLAARAEQVNGVPCMDLSDVVRWDGLLHPSWVKTQAWAHVPADVDRIVWLDVDVFPVRRMPLEDLMDGFSAVTEPPEVLAQEVQKLSALQGCSTYCNAGVFVCTRASERVLSDLGAKMREPVQGYYWDQSWLNVLLSGKYNVLPRTWNWMIDSDDPPAGVINVHAAGLGFHVQHKVLRALYAVEGVA
jgi:hypothetical protein